MLTIAETILVGKVSSALAANYNSKQGLFNNGALSTPNSPVLIRMATDALQWAVDGGAVSDSDLRLMANYVIWLCDYWGFEAQRLINNSSGGGTVIPSNRITNAPTPYYFQVGASSLIPTGGSSVTLSINWSGYNVSISRGGIVQTELNTESTYFTYNTGTRLLTFSPALTEGEIISIIPT